MQKQITAGHKSQIFNLKYNFFRNRLLYRLKNQCCQTQQHSIFLHQKNKSQYLYYFERAAETYLTALSTNKELNIVSDEVAEKTAQETANYPIDLAKLHLQQIRLILDKEEPEYKN